MKTLCYLLLKLEFLLSYIFIFIKKIIVIILKKKKRGREDDEETIKLLK